MTGFKQRTSGIGSNHSTNCATTPTTSYYNTITSPTQPLVHHTSFITITLPTQTEKETHLMLAPNCFPWYLSGSNSTLSWPYSSCHCFENIEELHADGRGKGPWKLETLTKASRMGVGVNFLTHLITSVKCQYKQLLISLCCTVLFSSYSCKHINWIILKNVLLPALFP